MIRRFFGFLFGVVAQYLFDQINNHLLPHLTHESSFKLSFPRINSLHGTNPPFLFLVFQPCAIML